MSWPWKRQVSRDQLIVSWSAGTLAFVRGRTESGGLFKIKQAGVERQGSDSMEAFAQRLQALGLRGLDAKFMLWPEQYQFLQIDAPAVAPEELRAAARYQVKEMVQSHIDDVTLDVMRVGDSQQKGPGHLFVVAATHAVVREMMDMGDTMEWTVSVIDIQETSQRNLQSALAAREGRADRAHAALLLVEGHQAVLTISANEELFYTRRLELPAGFLTMPWAEDTADSSAVDDGFTPVGEYVPDYSVGGESYGTDYSTPLTTIGHADSTGTQANLERAQRFLVEVQRSLDLWDRSWSHMPLNGLSVYAGERTTELAQWLGNATGHPVSGITLDPMVQGLDSVPAADRATCLVLLGVLMRTETRKL